jgi:Loader and inhibitor of phage G40P
MTMPLDDDRLKREMGELTTDLIALYEAKYPRFYNALKGLEEEQLIELMIELCDVFDLHTNLIAEVAKRYKAHRMHSGSLEDRDWPEN